MALCSKNIQTELSQFVYFFLVLREQEETKTKYSAPTQSIMFVAQIAKGCFSNLGHFFDYSNKKLLVAHGFSNSEFQSFMNLQINQKGMGSPFLPKFRNSDNPKIHGLFFST